MDTVRQDEESNLLNVVRRSRRARARMLRARPESEDSAPLAHQDIIDITEREPRVRLFAGSNDFPRSDRPFTPLD